LRAVAIIHRIAPPENASETRAVTELARNLSDEFIIFHNFELATPQGMPYEFDICVVAPHAVYHIEVKGYRGQIRGDQYQWQFENGAVTPSPIPLANKKTKILAGKLRGRDRRMDDVFVETLIMLTDDRAQARLRDDQAQLVVRLPEAIEQIQSPRGRQIGRNISPLHDRICEALFQTSPRKRVTQIGLYDIIERVSQNDRRTVFLGHHRYIKTRPQTILKVFHFNIYASEAEKQKQIDAIFHDQNALRLLGVHPNLIDTGDFFAWEDNKFVLPTEYVDGGRPLRMWVDEGVAEKAPYAKKADAITGVARGLAHAHKHGVIHRDVRPMNIVVARSGVVKLVNFDLALIKGYPEVGDPKGLAQRVDRRYSAPEVLADPGSATEASDIYSLGLVFHEVMTGITPDGEADSRAELNEADVVKAIKAAGPSDFDRSPEDVASVIARMCHADPKARYQQMQGVKDDLAIIGQ
jgi:hypothetical protein